MEDTKRNLGHWIALLGALMLVLAAWVSLIAACGLCVLLLSRKVRAYEVVK